MKLTLHRLSLPLEHEFRIARSARTHQPSVIVELSDGEHTGLGEVTANPYYGQTLDSIVTAIESVRSTVESYEFGSPEDLWDKLHHKVPSRAKRVLRGSGEKFALNAIDLAAHDLFGHIKGKPLHALWGLDVSSVVDSSYTIGLGPIDEMVAKVQQYAGWSCYKIKLGTENDIEIVRTLREHTDAAFRVDANCAWTALEAIEKSRTLESLGVEFIEQPLPADASRDDQQLVFDRSALPIIADENCLVESDVAACRGLFDGVNVKLSKCGGLTPGLRMLKQARELGLKTMLGCMVESSIGISAAAHLLPLLDYADLDGAVLLADEPCSGVTIERGRVHFADGPGSGAVLDRDRLAEFAVRL